MAVQPGRGRSRATLLGLFALFAAPVILAWLAFFVFKDWQPSGTTNHGELVQPPRPLATDGLQFVDGKAFDHSFLEGKWTYVLLAGDACEELCTEQLYMMRQLRLAQGKNIDRVQRLLVAKNPEGYGELLGHYPGLPVVTGSETDLAAWQQQFQIQASEAVWQEGRIYLVDPMGNLMMSYEPGMEPKGIVKDLERLLKISYVG